MIFPRVATPIKGGLLGKRRWEFGEKACNDTQKQRGRRSSSVSHLILKGKWQGSLFSRQYVPRAWFYSQVNLGVILGLQTDVQQSFETVFLSDQVCLTQLGLKGHIYILNQHLFHGYSLFPLLPKALMRRQKKYTWVCIPVVQVREQWWWTHRGSEILTWNDRNCDFTWRDWNCIINYFNTHIKTMTSRIFY